MTKQQNKTYKYILYNKLNYKIGNYFLVIWKKIPNIIQKLEIFIIIMYF